MPPAAGRSAKAKSPRSALGTCGAPVLTYVSVPRGACHRTPDDTPFQSGHRKLYTPARAVPECEAMGHEAMDLFSRGTKIDPVEVSKSLNASWRRAQFHHLR